MGVGRRLLLACFFVSPISALPFPPTRLFILCCAAEEKCGGWKGKRRKWENWARGGGWWRWPALEKEGEGATHWPFVSIYSDRMEQSSIIPSIPWRPLPPLSFRTQTVALPLAFCRCAVASSSMRQQRENGRSGVNEARF